MTKTLIIGDIHGRDCWKEIVAKENADKVIFIGDYFDSFTITAAEQMHNFKEILEYKLSTESEVILLIGNHDYHYMVGVTEHYSGYQYGSSFAIQRLLEENKEHMQMVYQIDEFLFTHAGVSNKWLNLHGYTNESNLIDWINDMWKYKPNIFQFAGYDPYGDSTISPPIWIRPKSLQKANYDTLRTQFIQVVGHTQQNKIDTKGRSTGGRYYYIDTLDTSGEYMVIEDGSITFPTYKEQDG